MTNYMVTGGAGFIGSHVVDMLAREHHHVMVLDNFSTGKRENLSERPNVMVGECDIRDEAEVLAAFLVFKPKAVIHIAAQAAISTAQESPIHDLSVNGIGTLTMLRMAEKYEVERFVYVSTSAVYGDRLLAMPETTPLRPDNYYGVSKATGELYTQISNIMTTILRFGNVYGPRQVPLGENQVIARMMRHLLKGEDFYIFGDGKQKRDFVFVEDVARAVVMAAQDSTLAMHQVYNIAGGQSYSVNEVAKLVARVCELPGYEWEYDRKRKDERQNARMEIDNAFAGLGWEPRVELPLGLRETLEWWKTQ